MFIFAEDKTNWFLDNQISFQIKKNTFPDFLIFYIDFFLFFQVKIKFFIKIFFRSIKKYEEFFFRKGFILILFQ